MIRGRDPRWDRAFRRAWRLPDVKADGGISPTSPQAGEVRNIGRKLHKAGGKAYMDQARDGLVARVPWANRNLETIWGGMKEWQG